MNRYSVVATLLIAIVTAENVCAIEPVDTVTPRRTLISLEKAQITVGKSLTTAASNDANEYKKQVLRTLVQATDHMVRGTRAVAGVETLLVGHVSLTNATNPWNDVDIRNWYDEMKDWGTVAGALVTAYALSKDGSSDGDRALRAGGVGLVGLSQAVGRLFGNANSNRLKEKAAFLDMTVRAYDDMLAHERHLENLVAKNKDAVNGRIARFAARKAALPTEAIVVTMSDKELLVHVASVESDLHDYETALRELLGLADTLEARAGGYLLSLEQVASGASPNVKKQAAATAEKIESSPAASKAQEDLRRVVKTLRDFKTNDAPAVYDFFNLSVELRNALKKANATLTSG